MGKLTRRELYERVWQIPMRTLAKEFKISDVGLKKICDRHDVPTPGLGYWAKVAHGKKVTQTKLPTKTGGEPDVIVIEPERWHLKGDVDDQWLSDEQSTERRIKVESSGELHSLIRALSARLANDKSDDWLIPPHGSLDVRVSRALLPRAISIMNALLVASERRGWAIATQVPIPKRRNSVGTFWYPPAQNWANSMPSDRPAETGVVIRNEFVAFSLVEEGEYAEPTESEIRAWRRQYPYGSGGPPSRKKPNGKLRLQLASHPWVSTRRKFHDLAGKPLEEQLNAVIVAFARMAGGLRAFSLKMALERREKLRTERRQREAERRRRLLEKNAAHLERGMEKWRWRESAMTFLAAMRDESSTRDINRDEFDRWLAWAESYVEGASIDKFFAPWGRDAELSKED
jgi:hypothetical protein